jgi:MFS family permease
VTPVWRRFWSLFALYLVPGLALASWVTRTPAVRDALHASTAEMGLIFFGLAVGSMIGVLSGTPLVRRFGTRGLILLTLAFWIGGTFVIAAGVALRSPAIVTTGLTAFGLGLGCAELGFNVDGAEVERQLGRPILSFLHASFSLGTVTGGLSGIWLAQIQFPPELQLTIAAIVALIVAVIGLQGIPAGFAKEDAVSRRATSSGSAWRDTRVIRIALIVLVLALAEGTANDWLPLVMVDGHGLPESISAVVYTAFAASMATGRLTGPAMLRRFSRVQVVAAAGCFAAIGLIGVMLSPSVALAFVAVVLWGLGASLGFPVSISAVAEGDPATAPQRVGAAASTGYIGFLSGPPLLGLLGEHFGLRQSLVVVLGLVLLAIVLAPAVRPVDSPEDAVVEPSH